MSDQSPTGPAVAILPARGGSKRIPGKNVRPFAGVPLLARTISILQRGGLFDRIIVSTDDREIEEVARGAGAEVPFRRPATLADDHTPTTPVIAHAVRTLEEQSGHHQLGPVCAVYPTAVLTTEDDLRSALALLGSPSTTSYVATATTFGAPIQRALRRLPDGSCEMLWPEHRQSRTQDLEQTYHDAGQFYWGHRAAWLAEEPMFEESTRLHVIPRWRTQDIDTLEDWERAELLFELITQRGD